MRKSNKISALALTALAAISLSSCFSTMTSKVSHKDFLAFYERQASDGSSFRDNKSKVFTLGDDFTSSTIDYKEDGSDTLTYSLKSSEFDKMKESLLSTDSDEAHGMSFLASDDKASGDVVTRNGSVNIGVTHSDLTETFEEGGMEVNIRTKKDGSSASYDHLESDFHAGIAEDDTYFYESFSFATAKTQSSMGGALELDSSSRSYGYSSNSMRIEKEIKEAMHQKNVTYEDLSSFSRSETLDEVDAIKTCSFSYSVGETVTNLDETYVKDSSTGTIAIKDGSTKDVSVETWTYEKFAEGDITPSYERNLQSFIFGRKAYRDSGAGVSTTMIKKVGLGDTITLNKIEGELKGEAASDFQVSGYSITRIKDGDAKFYEIVANGAGEVSISNSSESALPAYSDPVDLSKFSLDSFSNMFLANPNLDGVINAITPYNQAIWTEFESYLDANDPKKEEITLTQGRYNYRHKVSDTVAKQYVFEDKGRDNSALTSISTFDVPKGINDDRNNDISEKERVTFS